jgi:ADP-ribose pyrophosphatase
LSGGNSGQDAIPRPRVAGTTPVFDGRILRVRVDQLAYADGSSHGYERVEYGEAAVLVPVDADGQLLMVRQYRHAIGEELLELPAGGIDRTDESPEAAAQRELREETGFRGKLTRIGGLFLAPGYSDEYQHIYAAHDLVADALDPDEEEDVRLEHVAIDDALAMVDDGRIRDAKTIAALLMFIRHAGKGTP